MPLKTVKSKDGTAIAFEATGAGQPLILVGGAFCGRAAPASGTPLAALLAPRSTAYSYDRRGRGQSGDASPGAGGREVEDLVALLAAAGGSAHVFGNSSGALLALDAAAQGLAIPKLVLFEPPVILDPDRAKAFGELAERLDEAVAGGRRADAVETYFTQVMQMPAPAVDQMRKSPMWPGLEAMAHTLSYDLRLAARGPERIREVAALRAPTLILGGGASPDWMRAAIQTLARAIPGAQYRALEGQTHAVDPEVLARAIGDFLD